MAIYTRAQGHLVSAASGRELPSGATIRWDDNKSGSTLSNTAPIGSYKNETLSEDDGKLCIKARAIDIDSSVTLYDNPTWKLEVRNKTGTLVGTFTSAANTVANPSHGVNKFDGWDIYSLISDSTGSSTRATLDFFLYLNVPVITLGYDANGGSGAPESEESETGEFTISSVEPTRSGYTFLGWATSSSASSAEYQAGDVLTITEDTTLYAVWTQLPTFTITAVSAGNGAAYGGGEYVVGSTAVLSTAPDMGYVFDRWNDGDTSPERTVVVSADATYTAYFRRNWVSVDEYEFVVGANIDADHPHGDLDRIIIDGDIMPLRTGVSPTTGVERKRILRGEDIAFLWECIGERSSVLEMTFAHPGASILEFSRKLQDYPLYRMLNWVRTFATMRSNEYGLFCATLKKDSPIPTSTVIKDLGETWKDDWGRPADFIETYPDLEFISPSDLVSYDADFDILRLNPLRLSLLEGLFSDLSKIRRFLVELRVSVGNDFFYYATLYQSYQTGSGDIHEDWADAWTIECPANECCGKHSTPIVCFCAYKFKWQPAQQEVKLVYMPVGLANIPDVREIVPTVFELAGMPGWNAPGELEEYRLYVGSAYICADVRDKTVWDISSDS